MGTLITIFLSIILAGIIQGLIFGVVVVSYQKYRVASTLLLASLIVVFSWNNLQYYLLNIEFVSNQELFTTFWLPLQLLFPPLIFFYGLKLFNEEKPIPKITIYIFLAPFIIALLLTSIYKYKYYNASYDNFIKAFVPLTNAIEVISMFLTLLVVTWNLIIAIRNNISNKKNKVKEYKANLDWYKNLLILLLALNLVWLYVSIAFISGNGDYKLFYLCWIGLSVVIYLLGHIGIYKHGVHEKRKKLKKHIFSKKGHNPEYSNSTNVHLIAFEKLVFNEKAYLDPDLSIEKMASKLNISKSHLSRLINNDLNCSYNDYINKLRIEEAKFYITHPDFQNYTLFALGLEAGFSSKTTFNTTFKRMTGQTPSEYKKQIKIL